jgi:hypothetical protein
VGITVENIGAPVNETSIGQWVKRQTIAVAERVLREEVGKGFDNEPVVVTDGVTRRDYNAVRPFGKIEFIRRPVMVDAVLWALDELRRRSPIKTGRYVATHMVMVNGAELRGNIALELRNVKDTDRVQIVNPQPYARKLEGATANRKTGRGARKASSRQAPSGVYRVVVRELVQRFGRSMFFDYKMVQLNLGVKVWGKQGGSKSSKRVQRNQVYPALQFFIKGTGAPN